MNNAFEPTTTDDPRPLASRVASIAEANPDTHALSFEGGETWSYAELARKLRQKAERLAALGLPAGRIVALAAPARELLLAALAAPLAGHALLPLDPAALGQHEQALRAFGGERLYHLEHWPESDTVTQPDTSEPMPGSAPTLAIATSGSEGAPKIVLHSATSLTAAARASAHLLPLAAGDVWLACLPLFHVGGQAILWRAFTAGAAVKLHERFDAHAVWRAISAGEVTHVSLVPTMLARLLDIADTPPPQRLRAALIGGAALSHRLWQQARAAGWPLYVSYGMSETAAQIATLPPGDDWREGLVGKPLPGVELAIGEDGRVRIAGPQLMYGYLDAAGTPGFGLEQGTFISGDLGRIDEAGRLHILGRADDMLVSGGRNVHPREVESVLSDCPGVLDSAVLGAPDPVWGDLITALVVGDGEPAAIERWCRERLPSTLRPRRIVRVAALPRTPLGKLERRALPALLAGADT